MVDSEIDSIGLHVDMIDVDRLREWARLILVHGADIGQWGSAPFVASKLQILATDLEKTIQDIGVLRSQRGDLLAALKKADERYRLALSWSIIGREDEQTLDLIAAAIAKAEGRI